MIDNKIKGEKMNHIWNNELQNKVMRYVIRIKNPLKRKYAHDYVTAFKAGLTAQRPSGLSFMGAQAVSIRIAEIISEIPNGETII